MEGELKLDGQSEKERVMEQKQVERETVLVLLLAL